jgi:HK97 family phage prohead protease
MDRIEHRDVAEDENLFVVEGYASTFEEYEMYGGPANGYGYIERIDPSAFDKTLREKPDLHFLINHAGTPLARTKSGTCVLEADEKGLKVVATLDKRDPDSMGIFVKMERGDMDEMSFAFRVKAQEWRAAEGYDDDNHSYRTITEVSLHKGDVSIVNFGANPDTSIGVRSAADAVRYLAECDETELAEVRSEDAVKDLKVAQERLTAVRDAQPVTGKTGDPAADDVRELEGQADETIRTYEWLTAEAVWRADVLTWLNAERAQSETVESEASPEIEAALREHFGVDATSERAPKLIEMLEKLELIPAPVAEEPEAPKRGMSLRLARALSER